MAVAPSAGAAHLVGIAGIGMSGLARCLLARGWTVTGSDLAPNALTRELEALGVRIHAGHDAANVPEGCTLLVRSAAVPDENPEFAAAVARGLETLKYAQMLGRLTEEKADIAVAGCHGKTTTSAMIAYALSRAGFEPSFIVGGVIPQLGSSAAWGAGKHCVVEACEFDRSFLNLSPECAVITNVEEDHLDTYRDLGEIAAAFRDFATSVGEKGLVIGSLDNEHSAAIVREFKGRGETFSLSEDADWRAKGIAVEDGRWTFDVLKYGKAFGRFQLAVPGVHNVANALAAMAAATWAGVGQEILQLALSEFTGVARRFEVVGERGGTIVVDDYGHHPTEVRATLAAAKARWPDRKIWCVFQPHQHTRTRLLLKEFAKSFTDAHLVLLPDIYAAREDAAMGGKRISSGDLAKLLDEKGKAALYLPKFDDVLAFLKDKAAPDVVLITMGAGDVGEVARRFLAAT